MNKFIILLFSLLIFSLSVSAGVFEDELVNNTLKNKPLYKPVVNLKYNYLSTERVPIYLEILETISTKNEIYDGQLLLFRVKKDVRYNNNLILKRGTIMTARIASYTTKGMNGIPARIIIHNFSVHGLDSNKLTPSWQKSGKNFVAWVLPLKWILTPFYPLGSLTNFIVGTNAEISPDDTIKLYYYPDWNKRDTDCP